MNLLTKRIRTTLLLQHSLSSFVAPRERLNDMLIDTLDPTEVEFLKTVNTDVNFAVEIAKFDAGLKCCTARWGTTLAHYSWVQDPGLRVLTRTGRSRNVQERTSGYTHASPPCGPEKSVSIRTSCDGC